MDVFTALLIYTLCFALISLGIWISHRNEESLIMKTVRLMVNIVSYFLPKFVKDILSSFSDYIFYTRNPIMQVVYVILLGIGYSSFIVTAYPYVNKTYFGQLPFILLAVNMIFFFLCSYVEPGVVNIENFQQHIDRFPYDGYMYQERRYCETCHVEKPARSKHCGICNHCVARFDHHCTWVNNCIGNRNQKYFLLFLLTLVLITSISCFLVFVVFINIIDTRNLYRSKFTDQTGNVFEADMSTIVTFLVGEYILMSFLFMYLFLLFIVLGCFLSFHLFLVLTNKTTNEICKQRKPVAPGARNENVKYLKKLKKGSKITRRSIAHVKNVDSRTGDVKIGGYVFGVYSRGIIRNVWEVFAS